MAESLITNKVRKFLKDLESKKEKIYYNKTSDRFTSGIPDYVGVYNGVAFYIELKDTGEDARLLQQWHLERASNAGAEALCTDNFDDVVNLFDRLRSNRHEHSATL